MRPAQRPRQGYWLLCLGSVLAASAAAADPAADAAERALLLAGACYGCHSSSATAQATPSSVAIPALQGQSYQQLEQSLLAFRDGSRDSTLMMRISKGYSVDELKTLARHFAALPAAAESSQ